MPAQALSGILFSNRAFTNHSFDIHISRVHSDVQPQSSFEEDPSSKTGKETMRTRVSIFLGGALIAGTLIGLGAANAQTPAPTAGAASPIQHLVVIFQENISFDHYFGTYPFAVNPEGE